MTWFKVDDNLAFHRKTVSAGNAAMGLWVRAGSWCAAHLTDGFVPDHMIALLGSRAQASRLIKAGLWTEVPGGCVFHQWNEKGRQPEAKKIKDLQSKAAERQAAWRERNLTNGQFTGPSHDVTNSVTNAVTSPLVTPTPTRPDPLKETTTTSPNAAASGMDAGFDDFWAAYPKRVQKRDALKAWRQMRREKTPAERIIAGARGYAEFVRNEGRPPDKIKYPGSWLRAAAYDDHQPAVPAGPDLRDPADVLRAHWQTADAAAVARILGLLYIDPAQPPSDTTTYDRWTTQARRDWISHHHADAITALTATHQESA